MWSLSGTTSDISCDPYSWLKVQNRFVMVAERSSIFRSGFINLNGDRRSVAGGVVQPDDTHDAIRGIHDDALGGRVHHSAWDFDAARGRIRRIFADRAEIQWRRRYVVRMVA